MGYSTICSHYFEIYCVGSVQNKFLIKVFNKYYPEYPYNVLIIYY